MKRYIDGGTLIVEKLYLDGLSGGLVTFRGRKLTEEEEVVVLRVSEWERIGRPMSITLQATGWPETEA